MRNKLLFFLLSMTALVLSLSSCQREERLSGNGTPQDVTISVAAPYTSLVKSNENPGAGDMINRCILEIYEDGVLYGERQAVDFAGSAAFKANLIAGHTYDFVFWADYAEGNAADGFQDVNYNTADGLTAITVITDGYLNNDDTRDAFYGSYNVTVESGMNYDYNLTRPFGRVQMFTTDIQSTEADLSGAVVKVSYAKVPAGFNALSKTVSSEQIDLIPGQAAGIFEVPAAGATETQLSYDYIFASENNGETLVQFTLNVEANGQTLCSDFSTDNIPVRQNYRTNVRGNFLTQTGEDVDITVGTDPEFGDDDIEKEIIAENLALESCESSEPTADGVTISYSYTYDGEGTVTESGVGYRVKGTEGEYVYVAYVPTRSTESATVTLTGLEAATEYEYVCYFVLEGSEDKFMSTPRYFTTAEDSGMPEFYTPIADVRALYVDGNVTISEDWTICGTVISNLELNNGSSLKNVIIQDETAGIMLRLTENNTDFLSGDVLEVKIQGQYLEKYNGLLQINNLPNENVIEIAQGTLPEAKVISAAQLLTGDYESQYVAVENVQVVENDRGKSWVTGGNNTSITFESTTGETFVVYSSKYSDALASVTVPDGSGTLKGIVQRFNASIQLMLASTDDYAGLTGERFGSEQPEPTEPVIATVEQVLAAAVNNNVWYQLTGTISNISNTTYGNFDLTDETGTIYVYGLTAEKVSSNDKSFSSLGLKEGNIVTLVGTRDEYGGDPQIGGPAYYISHEAGQGGGEDPNPAEGDFSSNIGMPEKDNTTDKYYAHIVSVNGVEYPCIKFGTGSLPGTYTTPVFNPTIEGDATLSLWGAGWKGDGCHLVITVNNGGTINGQSSVEIQLAANDGATGNPAYNITFSDTDYHEFELSGVTAETTLTFSTTEAGKRGIITGINVNAK